MIYIQRCLESAGVPRRGTAVIVGIPQAERVARWLSEEILDAFPEMTVSIAAPSEVVAACDLAVVPLTRPATFAGEDVAYASLRDLRRLLGLCRRARHVLVFRTGWRGADVVRGRAISRWLLRMELERRAIALLRRWSLLRRAIGARTS